jgi:hypothetical protein
MSMVRACNVLFVCAVLAAACSAQKLSSNPASGANSAETPRPAIFQHGAGAAEVVASSAMSSPQLDAAGYRVASDEEIDGMEQTLEKYVAAFENLSLPQVRQVWPGLDRQHEAAFKKVFASFRETSWTRRLGLECAMPKVNGDAANVECRETLAYGPAKGKVQEMGPARVAILLKGQAGSWVVADMKGAN